VSASLSAFERKLAMLEQQAAQVIIGDSWGLL
jgi:hypothetical protein